MKTALLIFAVVALLLGAGCASMNLSEVPTTDDEIAAYVNGRLNEDSMTGRSTLSVFLNQGTAELFGTVPNEAVRQRALSIVRGAPGVVDVRDRTRN